VGKDQFLVFSFQFSAQNKAWRLLRGGARSELAKGVGELGEDQAREGELDGGGGTWQCEDEFVGGNAGGGAAEHGAAGDLLVAEHAEELAEAVEAQVKAALDDGNGLVARADAGAAGGEDGVDVVAGQELIEQALELSGVVGDDFGGSD
jgi:hypothetical protein